MKRISSTIGQIHIAMTGVRPTVVRTFDPKAQYEILRRNYRRTLAELRERAAIRGIPPLPGDSTAGKLARFVTQLLRKPAIA